MRQTFFITALRSYRILLGTVLCFTACQTSVRVIEQDHPVAYEKLPPSLLNSQKLSRSTMMHLRSAGVSSKLTETYPALLDSLHNLERRWDSSTEPNLNQRFALAELNLQAARTLRSSSSSESLAYYLRAAELAFPVVTQDSPSATPSSSLALLTATYNHACGQVAQLWHQHHMDSDSATRVPLSPLHPYHLQLGSPSSTTINPQDFDDFMPVDQLEVKGLRSRVSQSGLGGPLIGVRESNAPRLADHPNLLPTGVNTAVTATLDFSTSRKVTLKFHNVRRTPNATLSGRTFPLAGDYTAPLALTLSGQGPSTTGFWGLFRPEGYTDAMGLYILEPVDPQKIPVVLVHGLLSRPSTWKNTHNELLADPLIRERYQFWFYQYPTGYPIIYPAADFRDALVRIRAHYDPTKQLASFDELVVIGHSLGGVLTSTQIRDISPDLWNEFFTKPIDDLDLSPETRQSLMRFFFPDEDIYIDRVVFIATPHRGSSIADSWIGRIVSSLVTIPQELITFQLIDAVTTMTEIGQSLLSQPGNSINWLRIQSPGLSSIVQLPILPDIDYHSIIGDRGKNNSPDSSDGVVSYESAHLIGAESEKIVPAGHSAHQDPETVEELRRILREHAGAPLMDVPVNDRP